MLLIAIAFVFSIYTMLFYYPILPAEMVFTIGGILLLQLLILLLKDLKTRKLGDV
jgi:hypothetical protein